MVAKKKLKLAILLSIISLIACNPTIPPSNMSADMLFDRLQINAACEKYQKDLVDPKTNNDQKVRICDRLMYIHTHFYNNIQKTREYSREYLSLVKEPSEVLTKLASLECSSGNYEVSVKTSQLAIDSSKTGDEKTAAFRIYAKAILKLGQESVSKHQSTDTILIKSAIEKIQNVLVNEPESQDDNYSLLGLALLMKDEKLAHIAWKNYFIIPGYDISQTDLWNNNKMTSDPRNRLIMALAHSRMYEFAAMVSELYPVKEEEKSILEIIEYAGYTRQFETTVYNYFREIALGKANKDFFLKTMDSLNRSLWNSVKSPEQSEFSEKAFKKLLSDKFGTISAFNIKHNIFYLGHVIYEKSLQGTQDHKTVICNYKIIDFLYGNALPGWCNDVFLFGAFAGNQKQIFQFRVHMNEGAIGKWKSVSDSSSFNNWKKETEQLCLKYDLKSIGDKIKIDTYKFIYDSLKNAGLEGKELRMGFLSVFNHYDYCSGIAGHEVRHQIDGSGMFTFLKSRQKMEYNAIIASVIYSPKPLFAMSGLLRSAESNQNKFLNTYSKASSEIQQNLFEWLNNHKAEISGFDNNKPAYAQLEKLSEQQLIEAFKSFYK